MSYFFNLLMFLEKTETSLPLKLPPQEQRAMQCKRCQATMFILSSLSQNALVLMIPCALNIHSGKVSVKTLQSFPDIKFVIRTLQSGDEKLKVPRILWNMWTLFGP